MSTKSAHSQSERVVNSERLVGMQGSSALFRVFALCALCALAATAGLGACGGDDGDSAASDAGTAGKAAASAAGSGGASGARASGSPQLGAACTKDTDCAGGYVCDTELKISEKVPGAPGGQVDHYAFAGGSCTPIRLATYDQTGARSCDPTEPRGSQGCGTDGTCTVVQEVQSNASVPAVACRAACEPSAAASGCDRSGYTCDLVDQVCVDGCHSDTECRVSAVDTDGDGTGDALQYDASSPLHCDLTTARCRHAAGARASGDACTADTECAEDGLCLPGDAPPIAGQSFPGGLCTRLGCQYPGYECDKGTVCESLRPWLDESPTTPLCFQSCKVGAEPADQRLGKNGHGQGCRAGYRCHYNGGPGADGGVCVGGNYNDVKANNIGSTCKTSADCYSPFGMGRCLFYATSSATPLPGICTIFDCAAPGMPADMCGAGNECVSMGGSDGTGCLHHCKSASECPAGFGCTDDDGEPGTPNNCIPACLTNADCRSGEQCVRRTATATAGLCMLQ